MTLDEAKLQSRDLWDRMAPGWEKHKDYLWSVTRPVGEWLVEHVQPQPRQTILDIAAGPGDTGFVAARMVGDEGVSSQPTSQKRWWMSLDPERNRSN